MTRHGMGEPEKNPLDSLRKIDVGASPSLDHVRRKARSRDRRRGIVVATGVLLGVVSIATAINLSSRSTDQPDVATNPPATTLTSPELAESFACGNRLPVFATLTPGGDGLASADFFGTDGPAPNSTPIAAGQLVAHWLDEFDVAVELRWPGTPLPAGASTIRLANSHGLQPVINETPANGRFIANIEVVGAAAGCEVLSVEFFAPQPDPLLDSSWAFVSGLHPIADLADVVAEQDDKNRQATPGDQRPLGQCADTIEVAGDEPSEEQLLELAGRFIADRLVGAAAELCLTEPGLAGYLTNEPLTRAPGLPPLCLYDCPEWSLVAGAPQLAMGRTQAHLLVDYAAGDGTVRTFREGLTAEVTSDGLLLISAAYLDVDSWVSEATARAVISELLDALAAGQWDAAAATLLNEGSAVTDERLGGEDWYSQPYDEAFARLCATALCGAPYAVGETVEARELQRTMAVTFEAADGPITIPMGVGMFEGISTVQTLPPDGVVGDPLLRLDERLFGEAYEGALTIVRGGSVERLRDGESGWTTQWHYRSAVSRFGVADGTVVLPRQPFGESETTVMIVDGDNSFLPVGEPSGPFRGASTADGRGLVFIGLGLHELVVVDLESAAQVSIPCEVCVEPFGDEGPWFADAGEDRIAVGIGVGDSYRTSIYQFDSTTLELGTRVGMIRGEQNTGAVHLSPDGSTAAAAVFTELNQPSRRLAIFDTSTGEPTAEWTLSGTATIEFVDYDGRYVVAELSDDTIWVIDSRNAGPDATRIVDSSARVRFG